MISVWSPAFLLILFTFAMANSETPSKEQRVLQQLEKVQDAVDSTTGPQPAPASCFNCAYSLTLPQQCALDICGRKGKLKDLERAAIASSLSGGLQTDNETLMKLYKTKIDGLAQEFEGFLTLLKSKRWNERPKDSGLASAVAGFGYIDSVRYGEGKLEGRIGVRMVVDEAKTREALKELSTKNQDVVVSMADHLVNTIRQTDLQLHAYPPDVVLLENNPGLDLEKAYQKEYAELKKSHGKLKDDPARAHLAQTFGIGKFLKDPPAPGVLTRSPTPTEIESLLKMKEDLRIYDELTDPRSKMMALSKQFDSSLLFDESNRAKRISDIEREIAFLRDESKQLPLLQKTVSRCFAALAYGSQTLPSREELKVAQERFPTIVAQAKQRMLAKYSEHSRKMAEPTFGSLQMSLPPARDSFRADFAKTANMKLQEAEKMLTTHESEDVRQVIALTFRTHAEASIQETFQFCDSFAHPMFSDAKFSANDSIRVGWGGIRDPDIGEVVLAHEIGHHLSKIFRTMSLSEHSKRKHAQVRTCLRTLHTDDPTAQFLEEDFADFAATEVIPTAKANPFCAFISDFSRVTMESTKGKDPHSSDLFRAVVLQVQGNLPVPKSCEKLISQDVPALSTLKACVRGE